MASVYATMFYFLLQFKILLYYPIYSIIMKLKGGDNMFFQFLFHSEKIVEVEMSASEKFLAIIEGLLKFELKEHQSQHHLLYTANTKLTLLKNQLPFHRSMSNSNLKIGQFHKEQYESLLKQMNELQAIVDCYMELQSDLTKMNHRLRFFYDEIDVIYDSFQFYNNQKIITKEQKTQFHLALREDCLNILRKVY